MQLGACAIGVAGVGVVDRVEDRVKPGFVIATREDLLELVGDADAGGHDRRPPVRRPPVGVGTVLGVRCQTHGSRSSSGGRPPSGAGRVPPLWPR